MIYLRFTPNTFYKIRYFTWFLWYLNQLHICFNQADSWNDIFNDKHMGDLDLSQQAIYYVDCAIGFWDTGTLMFIILGIPTPV